MTLTPGKYTFKYKVCNWNMSSFGSVTTKISNRSDSVAILTNTITPSTNIGNNIANSFSGSTAVELNFNITSTGDYGIEFYTANAAWADAIISGVSLVKSVYISTSVKSLTAEATIKSILYYNMSGMLLKSPTKGLYIEKVLYSDGSFKTNKVFQK